MKKLRGKSQQGFCIKKLKDGNFSIMLQARYKRKV